MLRILRALNMAALVSTLYMTIQATALDIVRPEHPNRILVIDGRDLR